MKVMTNKFNNQTLWGAALLAGLTLSACSAGDDLAGNNSSSNSEVSEVKTEFALNIPRAATSGSRATAANTQGDGTTFLGMNTIHLLSFTADPTQQNASTTATANIALSTMANSDISDSKSSKVYKDVNVATGTKYFTFYGFAPYSKATETSAKPFEQGAYSKDDVTGNDLSTISFALQPIAANVATSDQTALLGVLNAVAGATGKKENKDYKWSESKDNTLKALYTAFIGLKAGSATSICNTLSALYNSIKTDVKSPEAIAIRKAMVPESDNYFSWNISNNDTLGVKLTAENTVYPRNLNLPDGAVTVSWDSQNSKFTYNTTQTTFANSGNTQDPTKICYPAPISYYLTTALKASDSSADITWPTTTDAWTKASTESNGTFFSWGDEVKATTRKIALKNNINYGVASLKMGVKLKDTKLYDNTKTSSTDGGSSSTAEATGKLVTIPGAGLQVTAIIVGGQPEQVDWKYELENNYSAFNYAVYDKCSTEDDSKIVATTSDPSVYNYTVLLPNDLGSSTSEQKTVYVALELTNTTGVEFTGQDGVIEKGATFYLVGKLTPSEANNNSGNAIRENAAVFMKDYQTTANFTISALKNAYNGIPDLRSTELELGLSVDLTWETGLNFDVEL